MSKYLIEASYTAEGAKGVMKAGGTARRDAVQKMVESLGGRLEAFYFVFGENDVHVILDLPENLTAAAISLAVMSTGAARMKTTLLLTPEDRSGGEKAGPFRAARVAAGAWDASSDGPMQDIFSPLSRRIDRPTPQARQKTFGGTSPTLA
jgi:uncharacterized protein with GYD domain